VSEKSTRKALDYAVKSTAARNRPVFRPEFQLCPCHTAEEPYNSSESGLKKEIPDKYDLNSNLITKTDARNIITTYKYDALNRLTSKTYNTSQPGTTTGDLAHTPYSCYQYGTAAGTRCARIARE
jgi:YD repeat-containing protein